MSESAYFPTFYGKYNKGLHWRYDTRKWGITEGGGLPNLTTDFPDSDPIRYFRNLEHAKAFCHYANAWSPEHDHPNGLWGITDGFYDKDKVHPGGYMRIFWVVINGKEFFVSKSTFLDYEVLFSQSGNTWKSYPIPDKE